MSNIVLERATTTNQKEIAEIEKMANSETYCARLGDEEIKEFIEHDVVFLIKKGNDCIGLVSYEKISDDKVHIDGLVVKEEFRRMGFAKQAMDIVLSKLSCYSRIELVTHPHNNNAICLYLSIGFFIESWLDNYFGDGEPRLMLVKK